MIYIDFITFTLRRMPSVTAKLLLLGGMALAVLPEPASALEQTCRGCLEACCKTHECIYESESGACTLRDCRENFCPKCVGLRLNPSPLLNELEAWLPLSLVRWPPRIVPEDHGVSGRPGVGSEDADGSLRFAAVTPVDAHGRGELHLVDIDAGSAGHGDMHRVRDEVIVLHRLYCFPAEAGSGPGTGHPPGCLDTGALTGLTGSSPSRDPGSCSVSVPAPSPDVWSASRSPAQ